MELVVFLYILLLITVYFITIIKYKVFFIEKILFLLFSFLAGSSFLNIWIVSFLLIGVSLLGEFTNFYIGKKKYLNKKKFLKTEKYDETIKLFIRYSEKSLFIGYLLGLYSGLISFLAGVYNIKTKDFLKFTIPGKIVGVGKYILVGYFLGNTYYPIYTFVESYFMILAFAIIVLLYIYLNIRKQLFWYKAKRLINREKRSITRIISKYIFYYTFIVIILYFLVLYFMFFVFEEYELQNENDIKTYSKVENIKKQKEFKVYFSEKHRRLVQPVNVVIISDNIKKTFQKIGWSRNSMFGYDNISIKRYLNLLRKKELPVINLYLDGEVQDIAFQDKSNSVKKRNHIRLRKKGKLENGKNIYLGAVSNDIGFELGLYNTFLVPIHDFSANIDKSRDQLLKDFKNNYSDISYYYKMWGKTVKKNNNDDQYFFSDGKVVVIRL